MEHKEIDAAAVLFQVEGAVGSIHAHAQLHTLQACVHVWTTNGSGYEAWNLICRQALMQTATYVCIDGAPATPVIDYLTSLSGSSWC